MTKINRGAISKDRVLEYSVDPDFHGLKFRYPLHSIDACHYEAKVYKQGKYDHVEFFIDVSLKLFDSYDNMPFEEHYEIEEDDDLLLEEDGEGIGYIIPETTIDLDEVVLMVIQSSLPTKPLKKGSQLPEGVKEEIDVAEAINEEEPSPWDAMEELIDEEDDNK